MFVQNLYFFYLPKIHWKYLNVIKRAISFRSAYKIAIEEIIHL